MPRSLVIGLRMSILAAMFTCAACRPLPLPEPIVLREARALMGTVVEIELRAVPPARAGAAFDAAYTEMGRVARMMNHYDAASVVSEINRCAGSCAVAAPTELLNVLRMAQTLSQRSAGAFDITIGALQAWRFSGDAPRIPDAAVVAAQRRLVDYRDLTIDGNRVRLRRRGMRIDLGGIAKLYILDAGLRVLRAHGITRALINGGGDIAAMGGDAQPWRIGIREPRADALAGFIELAAGYVASSGDYERFFLHGGRRYHHILDPRTGYPTTDLQHVSVVGRELAAVNGLSATLMVLGPVRAQALVGNMSGVSAYFVDANDRRWASPDFHLRH